MIANDHDIATDCQHQWMIDQPNGPTSVGVCKLCGETSEFQNSIPGTGWDRQSPQSKRAKGKTHR